MESVLTMANEEQNRYFVKYLEEKFTSLNAHVAQLDAKMDANTKLTQEVSRKQDYTNGKVINNSKRLDTLEASRLRRFPQLNTNILYLLAVCGVVALLIVAKTMGVSLDGIL